MQKAIYFVADAHLGFDRNEKERDKQARLIAFLRHLRGRAEKLYILGDLFDFWFEYGYVIPRVGGKVLYELYDLIRSGTEVVYIGGNHDFWIGTFLSDEIGTRTVREPMEVRHQGLRIYIAHGDGETEGEVGYKIMRRILRNPLCIRLFGLLHPDFAVRIARKVSRSSGRRTTRKFRSHSYTQETPVTERPSFRRMLERYRHAARARLEEGFDAVVFGHVHVPMYERYGDRIFLIVGDWMKHYTYAMLRDGQFELRHWNANAEEAGGRRQEAGGRRQEAGGRR